MSSQAVKNEIRWNEYKKTHDVSIEMEQVYQRMHQYDNTVDTDAAEKVREILNRR